MAPKGGAAAARAASGIIGRAAARIMPRVAAKATRASTRKAARQTARQAGRARTRLRLPGRKGASRGNTTKPLGKRTATKDPIDVATGEVFLHQVDLALPGTLPLVLDRTHVSGFRTGRWFGPGWSSSLDQRLEIDDQGACLVTTEGRILTYPIGVYGRPVMPVRGERWPLTADGGEYTVQQPQQGTILHFAAQPNARVPGEPAVVLPLKAIADRNGDRIDLDYDGQGILTRVRHSGGYDIDVDTEDGLIVAVRTGETVIKTFGYDDDANLISVTGPGGIPVRYEYDGAGRLTRWIDTNGGWYSYVYDERGRAVQGIGAGGYLNASLAYHGDRTVVTNALGGRTVYHLDERGQVSKEVDPLGHETRYERDDLDRVLAETDPLGRTVRYTYDALGNAGSITRPDGSRAVMVYNALGLPTETTDFDGSVWRYGYDDRGNLVSETDPTGATTRYALTTADDSDGGGKTVTVTDALGNTTRAELDAAGRPVTVTDPRGAATRYTYDALGRPVRLTDPAGGVHEYSWTLDGLLASSTAPDGAVERWTYDEEGNLTEHADGEGRVTRFEIGPFGEPAARIGPDGTRLEFAYDAELRLTGVTHPLGTTWRYTYDAAGRPVSETDFNGRTLGYVHDAAGQLVARTNGAGETVAYSRDVLGNVVRKQAGDAVTTFAYTPVGLLERATGGEADLRISRDALGRVTAETCNGRALTWTHNELGDRIGRRTPSGAGSVWTYDAAGLPAALRTAGRTITFEHDTAGRQTRRRIDDRLVLDQQWDAAHRLTSQAVWGAPDHASPQPRLLQHRTYAYRPSGGLSRITDRLSGDRRFDVDPAGRVTAVNGRDWTERYAYDRIGNVRHADWPAATENQADTAGDRDLTGTLLHRTRRVRYEYDAQGRVVLRQHARLSSKPLTWRFHWDAEDRLVAVQNPGGRWWRYRYDPLGRRIAKQELGPDGRTVMAQVDFTWDGPVLAEQTEHRWSAERGAFVSHTTTWEYEPSTNHPIVQDEHTSARDAPQSVIDRRFAAIVTDLIGTPAELVALDGSITWRLPTTLWGAPRSTARNPSDCPLRFPGQYHDPETGLHYNFHRYYDPGTGRYQSPDPLGLAPQPNPHAYVDNPLDWVDILGLKQCDPRDLPGTARGSQHIRDVKGKWMRGGEGQAGRMPGQIARRLEGRQFANWRDFREAFWKEVAKDPHLAKQFSPGNQGRMKKGMAPISNPLQWHGKKSYEIHHILPIQHGGGVYDMSNMVVLTPLTHARILPGNYHYG